MRLATLVAGLGLAIAPRLAAAGDGAAVHAAVPLPLPDGAPGIGFDDLQFSTALGKILVPAGRSGRLDLVDPASRAVVSITGFSSRKDFHGGHDDGVTSVHEGAGWLFATDRTTRELDLIDPTRLAIVARTKLGAGPDYVRFVAATHTIWVTEPDAERIELFRFDGEPPRATHAGSIAVPGGPESLVLDAQRGRAYTHLWSGKTVAIDVATQRIVATWVNGCGGSRGIALDVAHGFLFAACSEGKAAVLDVATGKILSRCDVAGGGVDIIDYDAGLGHLYVPSAEAGTLTILGVTNTGILSRLGDLPTAPGSHGVAVDANGTAYVGDPDKGALLVVTDPFPATLH